MFSLIATDMIKELAEQTIFSEAELAKQDAKRTAAKNKTPDSKLAVRDESLRLTQLANTAARK